MEKATTEEIRLILKMISRGYKVPKVVHDTIFEVARREIEDGEKVVLYKRDPNIHSRRIQGAYVKVIEGETLDINPLACGGFGADFDGDTTYCFLRVYKRSHNRYIPMRVHISEFDKHFKCELEGESCNGDTGILIKNFNVLDNVYCQAINSDGNIKYKKITHWSIHENLDMFSINRKKRNCLIGDIKELWVSKDHSLVVIDSETKQIVKATPEELINCPQRYFLIKAMNGSIITRDAREIMLSEDIRNNISEMEFGYYVGALLGDGNISSGQSCLHTSYTTLGHKWTDICENLIGDGKRSIVREGKHSYDNEYNLRDKNGNEYKKATHWGYRNSQVPFEINQFGNTCEDKHLPDWVINSTDDFATGLFAGYLDTDGMVQPKDIPIESKSKQLIDDFRFLLYYRLGIETSISEDFKNYRLGTGGRKIPILNKADYRKYWVLHLPIRKEYTYFLNKVQELLNNPDKKKKLREYVDACQSKPSTKKVLWAPREILKHPDFVKGRTEGVTSDIRFVIKKSCYTQKEMTIPDHIINETNIPEAFKVLLCKQNNKEIEIIPVNCLDIEHDPNMTIGYDFTVEDYATFTTDIGIFLFDTMAVFAPLSDEAQQEIKNKMITVNNNTKIGETNFFLEKDMVLGIFILTAEKKKTPSKKISSVEELYKLHVGQMVEMTYKGQRVKTTAGRIIFNELLPKSHHIVDENINKKKLTGLLSLILQKNESDYAITVDKVKDAGFKYATLYPKSLDLELLKIPPNLVKLRDELGAAKTVFEQSDILNEIDKKFAEHLEKERNDLYYIVESGSSKGILQPRQIIVCKGLISDNEGNIMPPITTPLNDGFSPDEYFESSAGSRKGTADRAINTGNGGYAYRKMVFVAGNVQADKSIADCYTKRTLDIKLTSDLFKRMTGRFVQDKSGKVTELTGEMIGSVVNLRSSIYCKTKKICRTCYGKLLRQVNSENVGLIAVQEVASLSEKIMKSSVGLVLYNDKLYTMGDLWDRITSGSIIGEDLETKVFESEIQGKDGLVKTFMMQKHPPKDKMLFISTKSGHTMICQRNHPMWIKKNPIHPKYDNRTCRLSGDEEYKSWGSGRSKLFDITDNELMEKEAKDVKKYDFIWIDNAFPTYNENNVEPEINGYIVGVFCGDECRDYKNDNYNSFIITKFNGPNKERIIKESYQFGFNANVVKDIYYRDPDCKMSKIVLGHNAWGKHLEPNFINYNKSWLKDFLAGYIDTDGTVLNGNGSTTNGTCCRIYTCSYHLVQQLKMICLKLGYHMNTTIVPPDKEGCKGDKQKRVHFSCDIRFPKYVELPNSEKLKRHGKIIYATYKDGEIPTKGFDTITTIKEIWKWEYPVYDISTETNEFLLSCVQNHNSFHLGGAVIMQKVDIIKEMMGNVDDVFEPHIRKSIKQVDEDLVNNLDLAIIKIDKTIFETPNNIVKEENSYNLPVGFFSLMLDDLDIPVIIERPVKIYKPEEVEEDDRYITLMYSKDNKMFFIGAKQENFSDLARYLDTLVGGQYPRSDVVSIYNKFYKALAPVGGWDSVHLEVIISNILRARKDPQKPARLIEPFDPEMHSIKTLPNLISYPLGLAFENFSKGVQYGMISQRAPESQIEKVMFGIPLTKDKMKGK